MLENPLNSTLFQHPSVQAALQGVHARRAVVQLGAFGHPSLKPLELWGTWPGPALRLGKVRGTFSTLATSDVFGSVTGKADALEESATYPMCFCNCVAGLHSRWFRDRRF